MVVVPLLKLTRVNTKNRNHIVMYKYYNNPRISWIVIYYILIFYLSFFIFNLKTKNMAKKINKEQENIEVSDIQKGQEIIIKQKDTLQELSVFELNNLLVSIENLVKYYTNIAIANDGLYTHDTKGLYTNARNKIQSLEYKKTEILLELEKRILN